MVSQHDAWFGVPGSSTNENVIHSICLVTSKDHLIDRSCEFISGSSSQFVTTLTSFVTTDIVIAEIKSSEFVT